MLAVISAERGFLADDPGIIAGVGGVRHRLADLVQVRTAADGFVVAGRLEPIDQQRHVDFAARIVHLPHVREQAVIGLVEKIVGPQNQRHFVAGFGHQQDTAQDALLGVLIVRQSAIEHLLRVFAAGHSAPP